MNFSFENQGTYTYLVYAIGQGDTVDSLSLGMLTNNKIAGLASTIFTQMDNVKYIKYNVSARISVKQFFTGPVNRRRLLGVFSGIVNALLSAEDYMIDSNTIILDLEYIFVDVTSCDTVLICLPVENSIEGKVDLSMFFKNIMFTIQSDQTENCDHVAKIINYLNSAPVFSLADFKKVLDGIQNGQPDTPIAFPFQQTAQEVRKAEEQPRVQPSPVAAGQSHNVLPTQSPVNKASKSVTPIQSPSLTPVQKPTTANVQPAPAEKHISMLGLLMHYNKENAAAYKAQKAAKKARKQTVQQTPNATFTVPGAPQQYVVPSSPKQQGTNPGFAIPGQVTPAPVSVQTPTAQPAPASTVTTKPVQTPVNRPITPAQPIAPQGQPLNFGETTVLGGGAIGETTVLSASQTPGRPLSPFLIRPKNNEKIAINKPVFRIGKERSYVDYFVGDNTAVSRSHANIVTHDGLYFIVDTNSTNHTYVNGAMIQSNIETKLNDGDKIRLANEDFDFKLM